jgi:predicted signal transduction protein with EAL and GGDEF domain
VVAPGDGVDVDDLLQWADVAMYVAKDQHSGVVRYDATQNHYDAANLALIGQLRNAIEIDQLVLHYQPKAALASGRIEAVEALVRWRHPDLGLAVPGPVRALGRADGPDRQAHRMGLAPSVTRPRLSGSRIGRTSPWRSMWVHRSVRHIVTFGVPRAA